MQNAKELGKKVAAWRKEDGLSQRELSRLSGVPLTAVRRCEQLGEIPLNRYLKLVESLHGTLLPTRKSTPGAPESPQGKKMEEGLRDRKRRRITTSKKVSRDSQFWENHGGVGLVWSNPDADDGVMIDKALLQPNFHLLLDIAVRFGLDRLKYQWEELQARIEECRYPEEMRHLNRAKPIVTRCLDHMEEAIRS